MSKTEQQIVTLDDVTPADCNKWFHCWGCDLNYQDPYAEIHGDKLVGQCECGATHTKPVKVAFEGQTVLQRRRSENQQITEFVP